MKRKRFLLGMLCGCLLGIAATMVWQHSVPQPPQLWAPGRPTLIFRDGPANQPRPPGVPPDARQGEINGQPYYIIPLAMRENG